MFEILIKNAHILDGTGNPYFKADIGIQDGKFAAIGDNLTPGDGTLVIDGSGLTAAPGFIDVHTHDDLYLLRKPNADEKVRQGITTVITGNCGFSPAPLVQDGKRILGSFNGILGGGEALNQFGETATFGEFLDLLEANRPGVNVAALVGNVTVRIAVMDHEMRPPTPTELEGMKALVEEAMRSGAIGLSSGLIYAPGSYAQADELTALAGVAARYNGIYTTHMRSESANLLTAIEEALQVGEQSGARVQISHLKVSGKQNWGKSDQVLALIEEARARGMEVTADQYPYNAGSTGLFALLPPDVLADGVDALSTQLGDGAFRANLRTRLQDPRNAEGMLSEADFDRILISSSPAHPEYEGLSLAQIADQVKIDPIDLIFNLVAEEQLAVTMIIFNMDEADIRRIMGARFVMMGSDGLPSLGARIHPRMSGTAPRILGHYSRQQSVLPLEEAIRKMTSLPAQTFRLRSKGLIKEGFDADLVLFSPNEIIDQATYETPLKPPQGIACVLVNGSLAVEQGRVLGTRAGKVLRNNGA